MAHNKSRLVSSQALDSMAIYQKERKKNKVWLKRM
jgi:hypothetical protein